MRPQKCPPQRPQPIDRAALTRQSLAAAVDRAVDTGLPQLTPVDVGLRHHANAQNEPTAPAKRSSPLLTATKTLSASAGKSSTSNAAAVDTGLHQLTPVDARLRDSNSGKTNPPSSPPPPPPSRLARQQQRPRVAPLSSRQLAAARLLACGRSPAAVAAEVGITRQAMWNWRRRADFEAEVFRLHGCITWTAGATGARRASTAIQRSM